MRKIDQKIGKQCNATNIITAGMMSYQKFKHSRNVGFFSPKFNSYLIFKIILTCFIV